VLADEATRGAPSRPAKTTHPTSDHDRRVTTSDGHYINESPPPRQHDVEACRQARLGVPRVLGVHPEKNQTPARCAASQHRRGVNEPHSDSHSRPKIAHWIAALNKGGRAVRDDQPIRQTSPNRR